MPIILFVLAYLIIGVFVAAIDKELWSRWSRPTPVAMTLCWPIVLATLALYSIYAVFCCMIKSFKGKK
jgi:hypothetical protein